MRRQTRNLSLQRIRIIIVFPNIAETVTQPNVPYNIPASTSNNNSNCKYYVSKLVVPNPVAPTNHSESINIATDHTLRNPYHNTHSNNYKKPATDNDLLFRETINTANINIPVKCIAVPLVFPAHVKVSIVADDGSNINCINGEIAEQYREFLREEKSDFQVRTGSGYMLCKQYLPVYTKVNGTLVHNKFYVVNDLPYQWLMGRSLLHVLGYRLRKLDTDVYHHQAEELDYLEDDDWIFETYPVDNVNSTQATKPLAQENLKFDEKLSQEQIDFLLQLTLDYNSIVSKHEFDVGCIPGVEFRVELTDENNIVPFAGPEYPHPAIHTAEIERQLRGLRKRRFISRSTSAWRAPTFIVSKKTGDARVVFDFRGLNKLTKRMRFGLASTEQLFAKFKGKDWITSLDVKSGYWNIPVAPEHRERLAFVFNGALYEWNVMPFGPTNAPSYFQYTMSKMFEDLPFVVVYMDDITVCSDSWVEHQLHLRQVFDVFKKYNIKLRLDKCFFCCNEVQYLGVLINKYGISPTVKYRSKVFEMPQPTTKKQTQRFLGLVNYLHKFIPELHKFIGPLVHLTHKNVPFRWTQECNAAFVAIKHKVMNAKFLMHPDPKKEFYVVADASMYGIGGMLAQLNDDGVLQPVEFSSKIFSTTQQNWHVSEQEIYAVVHLIEKWTHHLRDRKFTVYTDHKNLQELFNRAKNFRAGKLYRWAVRLQSYTFDARYIRGSSNNFADYLSRDGLGLNEVIDANSDEDTTDIVRSYINTLIRQAISKEVLYQEAQPNIVVTADASGQSQTNRSVIDHSCEDMEMLVFGEGELLTNNTVHVRRSKRLAAKRKAEEHVINSSPAVQRYMAKRLGRKVTADEVQTERERCRPTAVDVNPVLTDEDINESYEFSDITVPIRDRYATSELTTELLLAKQSNDPLLASIMSYLRDGSIELLGDMPWYVRKNVQSKRYSLDINGLLIFDTGEHNKRVVAPSSLYNSILSNAHDAVHHGGWKMCKHIEQHYYWINLQRDCDLWATSCDNCQKSKHRTIKKHGFMQLFSATRPFQLLSIDIVGPLPETAEGYRYIVTMMDKFSRYCMLIPCGDVHALTVVRALEEWHTYFGAPEAILSDNGPQFTSYIWDAWNAGAKTDVKLTTTYHPQCNGQIERLHRWIKERLRLISADLGFNFSDPDCDANWSHYLPIIQHTYNTTPNRMTTFSPNEIIFGERLRTAMDDALNVPHIDRTPAEYIEYIQNRQAIVRGVAANKQADYDKIRKRAYDKKRHCTCKFSVGDFVLHNYASRFVGNARKFSPLYIGPFEVIKIMNDGVNMKLREIANPSNVFNTHIDHIKSYNAAPPPLEMLLAYVANEMPRSTRVSSNSMRNVNKDEIPRDRQHIYNSLWMLSQQQEM